jgi:hypothetical protein
VQTADGGYALVGLTYSSGAGNADGWLVKTDGFGNQQWSKTYGGAGEDYPQSLTQTAGGGYAFAGYTKSYGAGNADAWLVKTDASGNTQWARTFRGTQNDAASGMVQTADGGYAFAGLTGSFGAGSSDVWLVKTDSLGNLLWNKTYGGTNDDGVWGGFLVQTSDGGYAMPAYTSSFGAGGNDAWLIKTDAAGNAVGGFKYGLAWVGSTLNTIELFRGTNDENWNYVRIQIWAPT